MRIIPPVLVGATVIALSLNPLYGFAVLGIVLVIMLVALPLSTSTVAATTTLLILSPDSPNLFYLGHLQITPRMVALGLLVLQVTIGIYRERAPVRFTFAVIWAWYLVVVVSGALLANRLQAIPLFLFIAILPYGVGCTLGADPSLLRGVLRGIIIGSCVLAAIAITEFIRHKAFISPGSGLTEEVRAGNLRANAGWQHPLALGMFFCLGAFVILDEARRRGLIYAALALILIAGGIFATQERSPLIGLFVGALVIVLFQMGVRRRARALIAIGIVVLIIIVIPGSRGEAFRQFLSQSTVTGTTAAADVTGREELLHLGIHAVRVHPLFGVGYGSGSNVRGNSLLSPLLMGYGISFTDIANWPLTIAIETGLLGLAAFIVLLCGNVMRLARRRRVTYPLPVVPALAGIVAAFVTSFGVATVPSSLLFVFVLGVYSTGCGVTNVIRPISNKEGIMTQVSRENIASSAG